MKAVISDRIYLNVDDKLAAILKDRLTYTIPVFIAGTRKNTVLRMYKNIKKGIMSIPSGRTDLIPHNYEIIDKRIDDTVYFPPTRAGIELRPSQQEVFDSVDSSCIINAPPSWGKTFTGLLVAKKLGKKTLIVTHTLYLRDQWEEQIKYLFNIKPAIIGSGKFNYDSCITISNVQTLIKRYDEVTKEFGTVLVDECLDYESLIVLADGTTKKIGTIVNNKQSLIVKSFNTKTKTIENKPIINWYKNPCSAPMIWFKFSDSSTLKCTMNHSIYKYPEMVKVPAEELMEGDSIISRVSHKSAYMPRKEVGHILLGLLLGDGSLSKTTSNIRIRLAQGEKQIEYLSWKISLLEGLFTSSIYFGKSGYKAGNKIGYISSSTFIDIFGLEEGLLYKGKKTKISKELAAMMTPLTWALLYQDDGSCSIRSITFSICFFDEDSVNNLIDSLVSMGVPAEGCSSFICNKYYMYLKLNVEASKIFLDITSEFIHPSMEYKFGEHTRTKPFNPTSFGKAYEDFTIKTIVDIDFKEATGGHKYNIEVEDTHNYFANGGLVANCHHTPSSTFLKIADSMHAKYKIGLSGTLERKDGYHVILRDVFSTKVFSPIAENRMIPKVGIIYSNIPFNDNNAVPWAFRVNELMDDKRYMNLLLGLVQGQVERGHKVLVVSDRNDILYKCQEIFSDNSICIVGETPAEVRNSVEGRLRSGELDVIFGGIRIFSEGISINCLSSIICATPINNDSLLTQLIGRICRIEEGKQTPEFIDIVLKGKIGTNQAKNRLALYLDSGFPVYKLNLPV